MTRDGDCLLLLMRTHPPRPSINEKLLFLSVHSLDDCGTDGRMSAHGKSTMVEEALRNESADANGSSLPQFTEDVSTLHRNKDDILFSIHESSKKRLNLRLVRNKSTKAFYIPPLLPMRSRWRSLWKIIWLVLRPNRFWTDQWSYGRTFAFDFKVKADISCT